MLLTYCREKKRERERREDTLFRGFSGMPPVTYFLQQLVSTW
jgi:hypothetical protein